MSRYEMHRHMKVRNLKLAYEKSPSSIPPFQPNMLRPVKVRQKESDWGGIFNLVDDPEDCLRVQAMKAAGIEMIPVLFTQVDGQMVFIREREEEGSV